MKFMYKKVVVIFVKFLWVLVWIANIVLNILAYIKESHWSGILMIVLCWIWLIYSVSSFVIEFLDLKKFCNDYDEQVEKLLMERREQETMTEVEQ